MGIGLSILNTKRKSFRGFGARNAYLHLIIIPILALIIVYAYYPIVDNIFHSLFSIKNFNYDTKTFVGFSNYLDIFMNNHKFRVAFYNTVLMLLGTLLVQLPIAFLLSDFLVFHIKNNRVEKLLVLLLFLPTLIPVPIYAKTWKLFFGYRGYFPFILEILGLTEPVKKLFGLGGPYLMAEASTAIWVLVGVQTWARIGFNLLVYRAAMLTIPNEIYESAEVDGAGPWTKLFHITVPLCGVIISTTVSLAILGIFQLFDIVWMATKGGPFSSSEVLATYMYRTAFENFNAG